MRICEVKNCTTPVFGSDKNTGIGYCKTHQYKRTDRDKRTAYQKAINASIHNEELDLWFDMVGKEIARNPYCWECKAYIPNKYYRHASAHILPKNIFESVATNPNNFLILGASCGCHHAFDSGFATEMEVFSIAKQRVQKFKHLIKEKHKLLNLFND